MTIAAPEIAIEVDPDTGIWRTDNLPMVYLPRHFLVNNHRAVEDALGIDTYRAILQGATEKSALHWCEVQARSYNLDREQTFHLYFQRLSQRGWGRFTVEMLDSAACLGRIRIENSVFALEFGTGTERRVCYMFEGFMIGAFRFLIGAINKSANIYCREICCNAHDGVEPCQFEFGLVRPD
ncbi:DUF5943 domain-containing protein [Dongia soli]|uniref:DUF5943 domain-containing protein n=1 Tax=Dongia soli TaxID=600628 RepID=A0ABU5EGG9_9PROT|nr:DUF5943 domain-containing protein [Dongia soli]MDY0885451.1 DUF5943 domain-containing protein [Dongia soli]